MIIFKNITIKNFLSFGNKPTTINLNTGSTTLILGENRDAGSMGYSRNGVGKSSIFQALMWCLFNEGINNIKQDDFINVTNKNKMLVTVELNVNGMDLVITRGRKPGVCSITKNGEPFTLSTTDNVDKDIVALLGMDATLFLNSIILSNNVAGFMQLKPAEQKQFMEQLLSLNILSDRAEALKSAARDNAVEIKIEEQNKINVLNNNQRIENNISDLTKKSERWVADHLARKNSTQSELIEFASIDQDAIEKNIEEKEKIKHQIDITTNELSSLTMRESQEISALDLAKTKHLSQLQHQRDKIISEIVIPSFDSEKIQIHTTYDLNMSTLENENKSLLNTKQEKAQILLKAQSDLKENEKILSDLVNESNKIKKEYESLDRGECFYCKQHYTSEEKLKELHDLLSQLTQAYYETSNENSKFSASCVSAKKDYDDFRTDQERYYTQTVNQHRKTRDDALFEINRKIDLEKQKQKQELDKIRSDFSEQSNVYISQYNTEKSLINLKYVETKTQLSSTLDSLKTLHNNITGSKEDLAIIRSSIKNLTQKLDDIMKEENPYKTQVTLNENNLVEYDESKLVKMKKVDEHYKILIKLLTDSKSFVRKSLIDQYIPFINQKIKFFLEEFDSPHKVTINNDLTVDIEYMKQSMSYGNLSNGERMRVNFAVSMAMREFVEMSNSRMNILMIDELLDNGLDSDGFYKVFHILEKQKKSTFIISHREELIPEVDYVLTVVKENGISTIHPVE